MMYDTKSTVRIATVYLFVLVTRFVTAQDAGALDVATIRQWRETGKRDKIPVLRAALNDANETVQLAAMLTLSQWYDDESRAAFELAVRSKSNRLQLAGREALYRLDALERFIPYKDQTVENLTLALKHERSTVRHEAVAALQRFWPLAKTCVPDLIIALSKLDAACRAEQVLPYLQLLRQSGADAGAAGAVICELLDERAKLYSGKTKHEVFGLRAYLIVTLADIRQAATGQQYIADMLANSDSVSAPDYAAAAYAAGSLGADGAVWVPFLMLALGDDFKDAVPVSGHGSSLKPVFSTSGRIEAIRALAKIGPGASAAIPVLEKLAQSDPPPDQNLPAWKDQAQKALATIRKARP